MLNIQPPDHQFCPFCSHKLEIKLEENKERRYCPSCKWTYYPHVNCAVGAVVIKDNKVLLVKRGRDPYKGTWMFPAGFIDFGEHPEETLKRELKEETGLEATDIHLIDILQNEDDPRAPGHFGIFYKVTVKDGDLQTDKEENQDIAWFELDKLPVIGWKSHNKIIQQYLKKE